MKTRLPPGSWCQFVSLRKEGNLISRASTDPETKVVDGLRPEPNR
jgi:hypothetical protein